jgi:hypothetical protein
MIAGSRREPLFDWKTFCADPSEQTTDQHKCRGRQNHMIMALDKHSDSQHNPNNCAWKQAAKDPRKLPTGYVN